MEFEVSRTYVITGAASGVGAATKQLLEQQGHSVIGVDIHKANIVADLSTTEGRDQMVQQVDELSGGTVDALVAVAGLSHNLAVTAKVNYFGALATLEGLRPLLAGSDAPRAVAVSSVASLQPHDQELLDKLLAGDEEGATARAEELASNSMAGFLIYPSSKQALSRWVRRHAFHDEWAKAGIPLNAVAPGVVITPMTAPLLGNEDGRRLVAEAVPMPLNGYAQPEAVAWPLVWLTSPENTHITGQVLFVDGGYDAITRGDATW